MKKTLALLLCIFTLLTLFSCDSKGNGEEETSSQNEQNEQNEQDEQNEQNEQNEQDEQDEQNKAECDTQQYAVYGDIIEKYGLIVEMLADNMDFDSVYDECVAQWEITDDAEKEELFGLLEASWFVFRTRNHPYHDLSCGYAVGDLNGDGTDELVLMNDEYIVGAVYSVVDGKPLLLGSYRERARCWIDGDGLIHFNGSSGADRSTNAVYKIADGGDGLELVAEFGTNGHECVGNDAVTIYYKLVDGETVRIDEDEHTKLSEQYSPHQSIFGGAELTKNHSGLTFIPLYERSAVLAEYFDDYDGILKLVSEIFNMTRVSEKKAEWQEEILLGDAREQEWFDSLLASVESFFPSDVQPRVSIGYTIEDLDMNGIYELILITNDYDILAIFTVSDGRPELLGSYTKDCVAYVDHKGYIYTKEGETPQDLFMKAYCIGESGASLELLVDMVDSWDGDGYRSYLIEDGERILPDGEKIREICEEYVLFGDRGTNKNCANLTHYYLSNRFPAREAYARHAIESALDGRMEVYDHFEDKYVRLVDLKTAYGRVPLGECENLKCVYIDMDGDRVSELVIDCGDSVLLRYYKGEVYAYSFSFRGLYYLNTDGSSSWNHTGQDFEYGERKIFFVGDELRSEDIWRIVNDGEPDAEYYLHGERVTLEVLQGYFKNNPKTLAEFSPIELSSEPNISEAQAWEIANEYFGGVDGDSEGACGTTIASYVVRKSDLYSPAGYYRFELELRYISNESHTVHRTEMIDVVFVNMTNGVCVAPSTIVPDGK